MKDFPLLRKLVIITAIIIFYPLLGSCENEDTTTAPKVTDAQKTIQSIVNDALVKYKAKYTKFPGGLAIYAVTPDGEFFASAGLAEGVDGNTKFRAASNTKTFTAAAILLLSQQGKLNLSDKITDLIPGSTETYLPDTPEFDIPYKSSITILQLLRHRAGVFDVSNESVPEDVAANVPYKGKSYLQYVQESDPNHTFTFDELIGVVAKCKLSYFEPGAKYHYSNTGYSILGKIIERVSGQSYQRFLTDNVLAPLGMPNSSMPVLGSDKSIPSPFAKGYVLFGGETYDVTESNISANVAEGNLITTPAELAKGLRTLLSGKGVLQPNIVNSIMMNYISTGENAGGYGCGLTYTNNLGYGHTGAHEGYLSQMVYDPVNDIAIVAYSNAWNLENDMTSLIEQLKNLLEDNCYRTKAAVIGK